MVTKYFGISYDNVLYVRDFQELCSPGTPVRWYLCDWPHGVSWGSGAPVKYFRDGSLVESRPTYFASFEAAVAAANAAGFLAAHELSAGADDFEISFGPPNGM